MRVILSTTHATHHSLRRFVKHEHIFDINHTPHSNNQHCYSMVALQQPTTKLWQRWYSGRLTKINVVDGNKLSGFTSRGLKISMCFDSKLQWVGGWRFIPASLWGRVGTGGGHRAGYECPYPSLHRSCTAGRCCRCHSRARTAPVGRYGGGVDRKRSDSISVYDLCFVLVKPRDAVGSLINW